ncbi:MAG: hypothetical protein LQ340_007822, partial [Diploschistes diacapsis]
IRFLYGHRELDVLRVVGYGDGPGGGGESGQGSGVAQGGEEVGFYLGEGRGRVESEEDGVFVVLEAEGPVRGMGGWEDGRVGLDGEA